MAETTINEHELESLNIFHEVIGRDLIPFYFDEYFELEYTDRCMIIDLIPMTGHNRAILEELVSFVNNSLGVDYMRVPPGIYCHSYYLDVRYHDGMMIPYTNINVIERNIYSKHDFSQCELPLDVIVDRLKEYITMEVITT